MRIDGIEFRSEYGHIVMYKDGKFYGTAQSIDEAIADLKEEEREEEEARLAKNNRGIC